MLFRFPKKNPSTKLTRRYASRISAPLPPTEDSISAALRELQISSYKHNSIGSFFNNIIEMVNKHFPNNIDEQHIFVRSAVQRVLNTQNSRYKITLLSATEIPKPETAGLERDFWEAVQRERPFYKAMSLGAHVPNNAAVENSLHSVLSITYELLRQQANPKRGYKIPN